MTEAAPQITEMVGTTRVRADGAANAAIFGHGDRSWQSALDAVSAQEISELVSGALEAAMMAAAEACPATYIEALKDRKRDGAIARMNRLPPVQLSHPVVLAEVRKEFAMMRAQTRLAHEIAEGIRSYARSKRRASMTARA